MDFNIYDLDTKIMLTAILSLSFVTLLVIILHIYVRCIINRRLRAATATTVHQPSHISDPNLPNSGLGQAVIDSLPCFPFKQMYGHDEFECAVCLSSLQEGELTRRLPNCEHDFHVACIDKWLTSQSTCPICRSQVTPRLAPLDREPPIGGGHTVVSLEDGYSDGLNDDGGHDMHVDVISTKMDKNGSGVPSSSSSSFRLSSFRRMLDRNRSSSSRRIQVYGELVLDLEKQG